MKQLGNKFGKYAQNNKVRNTESLPPEHAMQTLVSLGNFFIKE